MNSKINTRMVHQSFTSELSKSNFFKAILRKLAIICVSNEGLTEVDSYSLSMICTACWYSVTTRVQEEKAYRLHHTGNPLEEWKWSPCLHLQATQADGLCLALSINLEKCLEVTFSSEDT